MLQIPSKVVENELKLFLRTFENRWFQRDFSLTLVEILQYIFPNLIRLFPLYFSSFGRLNEF